MAKKKVSRPIQEDVHVPDRHYHHDEPENNFNVEGLAGENDWSSEVDSSDLNSSHSDIGRKTQDDDE